MMWGRLGAEEILGRSKALGDAGRAAEGEAREGEAREGEARRPPCRASPPP
jgi:hypothetical protein